MKYQLLMILKVLFICNSLAGELSTTQCKSLQCVREADRLLSNVNPKVDPCDDFYEFACGGFKKNKFVSNEQDEVSALIDEKKTLKVKLFELFKYRPDKSASKLSSLVEDFFTACMNIRAIDVESKQSFGFLSSLAGHWPVVEGDNWLFCGFQWDEATYTLESIGVDVNYFLNVHIDVDPAELNKYAIILDHGVFGIPRENLVKGFSDPVVDAYYKYMINVAVHFGANRVRAKYELKNSLQFEMILANISYLDDYTKTDFPHVLMQDLNETNDDSMIGRDYIIRYLNHDHVLPLDDVVVIRAPQYIKNLLNILQTTPSKILANYFMWRTVHQSVPFLSKNVRDARDEFEFSIKRPIKSRWLECVDITEKFLPKAVGALYIEKYFNQTTRMELNHLFDSFKGSFKSAVLRNTWLSGETTGKLLQKFNGLVINLGYFDEQIDDDELNAYYSDLHIDPSKLLLASFNITINKKRNLLKIYKDEANYTDRFMNYGITEFHSFYNELHDIIQIPAGLMQNLYFNEKRPMPMNFGAAGTLIARHLFEFLFKDAISSGDGRSDMHMKWSKSSREGLIENNKCLVNFYNQFNITEINRQVNGTKTQLNNLIELETLKLARKALDAWLPTTKSVNSLPGKFIDKYTPQMLFWLSYASTQCSQYTLKKIQDDYANSNKAPNKFLVLGTLSNIHEFDQDFRCTFGVKMNPDNKCSVF